MEHKVHPEPLLPSASPSSSSRASFSMTARREVYTLWMKSLVFSGNGCAVYDSTGRLAYRVDNYDRKCSDEVYLMDHGGRTLCKILRRVRTAQTLLIDYEEKSARDLTGLVCHDSERAEKRPWFRVKKDDGILRRSKSREIEVMVGCSKGKESCYRTEGLGTKLAFKIKDLAGRTVAELGWTPQVGRKRTEGGVVLGEDVLMLVVEPNADRLLIMGLMVVCGLIKQNM
ncbi:hypothetical protein B296_00053832 [Ensete ventricosum]|uniref:Uncharacterized protein n=1 Tax=Ensete ventricosum TaxID=4639 RepID=A0A426Y6A4_ENSVE|nr:hypothetical protein B296_00053832 [Ensete ventricosum]